MNNLALEQVGLRRSAFEDRLMELPERQRREVVERALQWGVERGIEGLMRDHGPALSGLGQDELNLLVSRAIERAIKPMIPTLQKHLMEAAEPAAKKAADVIGPVVERKLKEQVPKFAAITGVVTAALTILGMFLVGGYVVRKVG